MDLKNNTAINLWNEIRLSESYTLISAATFSQSKLWPQYG